MSRVRAVLDTNIYVSALMSARGVASRVFEAGFHDKLFVPVTSPAMLDELIEVITRPRNMRRLRRGLADLAAFRLLVKQNAEVVPGEYQRLDIVPTDVKDNPIAATALEAQAQYLVTQDAADLLRLKAFRLAAHRVVQIINPVDFLREVLGLR